MEVPTRNFLDPITCTCPHPTLHWQHEDGHKEILSHVRILIPEKKIQDRSTVTRLSDNLKISNAPVLKQTNNKRGL